MTGCPQCGVNTDDDCLDTCPSRRRGRGRPPVGPDIHIRLPEDLADLLRSEAEAADLPLAEIIRRALAAREDYAVITGLLMTFDRPMRRAAEIAYDTMPDHQKQHAAEASVTFLEVTGYAARQ